MKREVTGHQSGSTARHRGLPGHSLVRLGPGLGASLPNTTVISGTPPVPTAVTREAPKSPTGQGPAARVVGAVARRRRRRARARKCADNSPRRLPASSGHRSCEGKGAHDAITLNIVRQRPRACQQGCGAHMFPSPTANIVRHRSARMVGTRAAPDTVVGCRSRSPRAEFPTITRRTAKLGHPPF